MRALVLSVSGTRRVELAPWVKLRAPSADDESISVVCDRCGSDEKFLALGRHDSELMLGRFAVLHGRCGERPLVLLPVKAHFRKRWAEGPEVPITYVRKRDGG